MRSIPTQRLCLLHDEGEAESQADKQDGHDDRVADRELDGRPETAGCCSEAPRSSSKLISLVAARGASSSLCRHLAHKPKRAMKNTSTNTSVGSAYMKPARLAPATQGDRAGRPAFGRRAAM